VRVELCGDDIAQNFAVDADHCRRRFIAGSFKAENVVHISKDSIKGKKQVK
jgi:hypothetical protein